jgi:hypothetical protein
MAPYKTLIACGDQQKSKGNHGKCNNADLTILADQNIIVTGMQSQTRSVS